MEEIKMNTELIIGKAKSSLKTEAHFNKVDKLADKLKSSKVGRYISPATLTMATGLAYSLSVTLGKKVAFKAGAVASLGLAVGAVGAIAGVEESYKVTKERKQHNLEMAEGGSFDEKDKGRVNLEKFRYDMVSANDLRKEIESALNLKKSKELRKKITEGEMDQALNTLAKIEARRKLNYERKIDLISYSGIENVEEERKELDILVAKTKCQMRKILLNYPEKESFDSYLSKLTEAEKIKIIGGENGLDKKDKNFKKYKNKKVAKKVLSTVTIGAVFGLIAQEGIALVDDKVQSIFEGVGDQTIEQTPLNKILGLITGERSSRLIEGTDQTQVGASEYIANHQEQVTNIIRENWMDNNTDKFDLNELQLKWGGDSGLDNEGNIAMHIKDMASDGSFHDNISMDVPKLTGSGVMKVIFSLTNETQAHVFEVPINADGSIIIDPDSEIGKLFFDINNQGQVSFKGRFAEIVKSLGVNGDGTEKVSVVSTLVGQGNNNITNTIKSFQEIPIKTQMPWFLPFLRSKGIREASFGIKDKKPSENTSRGNVEKVVPIIEKVGEEQKVDTNKVKKKKSGLNKQQENNFGEDAGFEKVIPVVTNDQEKRKTEIKDKKKKKANSVEKPDQEIVEDGKLTEGKSTKEKIQTGKLLEIGTEMFDESGEIILKIIDVRRRFLLPDVLTLEFVDKQTNQVRSFTRNKRDIIKKLDKEEIKIHKISENVKVEEDEDASFFMK
jgi:hypothetical protein